MYKLGFKRDNWFLIVQCFLEGCSPLLLLKDIPWGLI